MNGLSPLFDAKRRGAMPDKPYRVIAVVAPSKNVSAMSNLGHVDPGCRCSTPPFILREKRGRREWLSILYATAHTCSGSSDREEDDAPWSAGRIRRSPSVGTVCLWGAAVGPQSFVMQRGKDEKHNRFRAAVSAGVSREGCKVCRLHAARDDAADASGDRGHRQRPEPPDRSTAPQARPRPASAKRRRAGWAKRRRAGWARLVTGSQAAPGPTRA